jgi:uncharacterized protein YbjT (DUF2867 family)
MRVLLLGADGLIGSAVVARLHRDGIEVVGVTRHPGELARRLPVSRWIALDLRDVRTAGDWLPHLGGVDAVVNCAGVLQDNARDSTARVHADAPAALWEACARAGIRRVIQVSALGVDRGGVTRFSESKRLGDEALEISQLDWVILRPSVVLGRAAHGGSALIRALAAFPLLPRTPEAGLLDVVQLDDVAETVAILLRPDAPARLVLELAGPERLSFEQVIAAYRQWLGRPPAKLFTLPAFVMAGLYRLGDLVAWLGWRSAIRTTGRREIARGSTGDPADWTRLTGIRPRPLSQALDAEPSGVQERWFANLYLVKPVLFVSLALYWLLTGLISLGPGYEAALGLMRSAGCGSVAAVAVIGGAIADITIAAGIAFRRTARAALLAALSLSILYLLAGTLLSPQIWVDPLGPFLKIWPIMALNLACLAIVDER